MEKHGSDARGSVDDSWALSDLPREDFLSENSLPHASGRRQGGNASPLSVSALVPFATGGRASLSLILDQGSVKTFSVKGRIVNIFGSAWEAI